MAPHIAWQLLAYVVLTCAEVMVSITCLEFSYTQAPKTMKSFVMAFFMLSISAGNLFTSAVNFFIENPDGSSKLAGADYFEFFTVLMLITAILFAIVSRFYKGEQHLQDELPLPFTHKSCHRTLAHGSGAIQKSTSFKRTSVNLQSYCYQTFFLQLPV